MLTASEYDALAGFSPGIVPGENFALANALSWPNAITLSGYAAGIAWLAGAGPACAFWSILADELDGASARSLGETSAVGDRLDHTVDVCMLALVGLRLGLGWIALPATLFAQVLLKEHDIAPPFFSSRAALMAYAL